MSAIYVVLSEASVPVCHFLLLLSSTYNTCIFIDIGVFPLVFLPEETSCDCGGELSTYPRPSFVTLYCSSGLKKGSCYHKTCTECKKKHYASYTQSRTGEKLYRFLSTEQEYFFISNRTAFETLYLKTTSDLIENAAVNFVGLTDSYFATHSVRLEKQRLEEAYFLYRLLLIHKR